jgi:hypothetical protein
MKESLISQMNFKYPHPIQEDIPLIKVNKVVFDSKKYLSNLGKSAISNTKAYSSFEDICV